MWLTAEDHGNPTQLSLAKLILIPVDTLPLRFNSYHVNSDFDGPPIEKDVFEKDLHNAEWSNELSTLVLVLITLGCMLKGLLITMCLFALKKQNLCKKTREERDEGPAGLRKENAKVGGCCLAVFELFTGRFCCFCSNIKKNYACNNLCCKIKKHRKPKKQNNKRKKCKSRLQKDSKFCLNDGAVANIDLYLQDQSNKKKTRFCKCTIENKIFYSGGSQNKLPDTIINVNGLAPLEESMLDLPELEPSTTFCNHGGNDNFIPKGCNLIEDVGELAKKDKLVKVHNSFNKTINTKRNDDNAIECVDANIKKANDDNNLVIGNRKLCLEHEKNARQRLKGDKNYEYNSIKKSIQINNKKQNNMTEKIDVVFVNLKPAVKSKTNSNSEKSNELKKIFFVENV